MCSSLEEFNFHNNITSIGPAAFAYCSNLKMDELPANLKELGPGSFRSCSNITVTKIPKDLEVLGSFSFVFCPKVKIAVFGSNDGSSKLKTIGQQALYGAGTDAEGATLTSVTIEKTVTLVEINAFTDYASNTLTEVLFANSADAGTENIYHGVSTGEMGFNSISVIFDYDKDGI